MMSGNRSKSIRLSAGDRLFYAVTYIIVTIMVLLVLYPLLYVLAASFSSPSAVAAGKVICWPVEFTLRGYKSVFGYSKVFIGYRNTIFYTVVGTFLNVLCTLLTAYPLSRKELLFGKQIMMLFSFTMIFSGGMIPTYILMSSLGLVDTYWAMWVPGLISIYNMIIMRTFLQGIPNDLMEAAKLDGCSYIRYLILIVIPLSHAVIAVVALYYAVAHWNSFFNAFLYLSDIDKFPLQVFLRQILIVNSIDADVLTDEEAAEALMGMRELVKYALIVVSALPIMCVYPFIQKYFVKGVMIGSIKG